MHVYCVLDNVQLHMAMLNADIEASVLLATDEVIRIRYFHFSLLNLLVSKRKRET